MISPIGQPNSPVHGHANFVLKEIIQPALERYDYDAKRFDHLGEPGKITERMIERIRDSPLCIAVLTDLNVNVMYEVAIRHAWDLPIVLLADGATTLPFDLRDCNTVIYSETRKGIASAIKKICQHISRIHKSIRRAGQRRPPKMQAVFFEAMQKISQGHSLEPLFRTKEWLLRLLIEQLKNIKDEVDREAPGPQAAPKPMARIAEMPVPLFNDLAGKVRVIEQILSFCNHDDRSVGHCKMVIQRLKELQNDGSDMLKRWRGARGTHAEYKKELRKLESLIETLVSFLPHMQ